MSANPSPQTAIRWTAPTTQPYPHLGGGYQLQVFESDAPLDSHKPAMAYGATEQECQYRARLIAAAPDLLEQLTRVLDQWSEQRIIGPTVYADARAALTRAQGGES